MLAVVVLSLALGGCALFERSASCAARKIIGPDVLKIQSEHDTPNFCQYHRTLAELYAPYAILSLNAYEPRGTPVGADPASPGSCENDTYKVRCPAGWSPDREDRKPTKKDLNGLFMEAFVHTTARLSLLEVLEHVIAFRGTEPSDLQDWRANLRWLLPYFRRTDQYPEARKTAVEWTARACRLAGAERKGLRIVTTGHSLGGGLAQGAAYAILRALPPAMTREQLDGDSAPSEEELVSQKTLADACKGVEGPIRVVSVVFDPSPVTGYSDGQALAECENPRSQKCRLPIVVRVYESGEILASLRRFLSWFYPVSLNICEDRFNFGTGLPIDQHQMRRIASGLIRIAKDSGEKDIGAIFDHHCPAPTTEGALLCNIPVTVPCASDNPK